MGILHILNYYLQFIPTSKQKNKPRYPLGFWGFYSYTLSSSSKKTPTTKVRDELRLLST